MKNRRTMPIPHMPKYSFVCRTIILTCALVVLASHGLVAQKPLLSPRDSVSLTYGDGRVFIDYGRPSMRGRKIMGGLVPYNRWWRTGANEATSFTTDMDLMIGDSLVPAGAYTLYTFPSEHKWLLIINRQTGQWGTVYNQDLDLVRIPLVRRTIDKPLEMFTITLERSGTASGVLRLRWETTDVSVPFDLRRDPERNE